jgi:hypothetical protein
MHQVIICDFFLENSFLEHHIFWTRVDAVMPTAELLLGMAFTTLVRIPFTSAMHRIFYSLVSVLLLLE